MRAADLFTYIIKEERKKDYQISGLTKSSQNITMLRYASLCLVLSPLGAADLHTCFTVACRGRPTRQSKYAVIVPSCTNSDVPSDLLYLFGSCFPPRRVGTVGRGKGGLRVGICSRVDMALPNAVEGARGGERRGLVMRVM